MPPSREIESRPDLSADVISLTFDDGPAEWTEPILETLRHEGVRATFFVVGDSIRGRERLLARAAAEGHEIGNHTLTHPLLPDLSPEEIRTELTSTNELVTDVVGRPPRVFRPPYFKVSPAVLSVAAECGFEWAVQASVWTTDWSLGSAEEIVGGILPRVERGSIIDLHDGRPPNSAVGRADRLPTVDAVAAIVPELLARGFELVTVSELIAL